MVFSPYPLSRPGEERACGHTGPRLHCSLCPGSIRSVSRLERTVELVHSRRWAAPLAALAAFAACLGCWSDSRDRKWLYSDRHDLGEVKVLGGIDRSAVSETLFVALGGAMVVKRKVFRVDISYENTTATVFIKVKARCELTDKEGRTLVSETPTFFHALPGDTFRQQVEFNVYRRDAETIVDSVRCRLERVKLPER